MNRTDVPIESMPFVVFDWDGTMVDSAARIVDAVCGACRRESLTPPDDEQIVSMIGLDLVTIFERFYPDLDAPVVQRLVGNYRDKWLTNAHIPAPLFPGARDSLELLMGQSIFLGVATGKSRRGLNRSLGETGLTECFLATRAADESFAKPHPQMLLDLLDMTGCAHEHTVMVGDTSYDIEMAKNAGIRAVGVTWGAHDTERLCGAGANAQFDDFPALSEWIISQYS